MIAGAVIDADGKPVRRRRLVVVASRFRWLHRDSDKPASELLGRGRCDERGQFRIELAGEPESDEGRVVLVATCAQPRLRGQGVDRPEHDDRRADASCSPSSP